MKKYLLTFIISVVLSLILFIPFDCLAEETYANNGFIINKDNEITGYTGSEAHIVIPDGITSIKEDVFRDNNDILSVTIPASVTSIESLAFAYCPNLSRVSIGGELVKMGYGVFNYTPWMKSQTDEYVVLAGTLIAYNGKSTSLQVPDGTKYVTGGLFPFYQEGNDYLFYGGRITSVKLPDGLLGINDGAFGDCNKLESITIPDSVTYIGRNAFSDCKALSYVKLPANLEVIDALAFSGCSSLESIDIPYGTRRIKNSFGYCTALKSVVIPDSVTLLGDAFFGCTALEKVRLSNNITNLFSSTFERTIWFEDSKDEFLVSGGILVKYSGNGGTVVLPKGIRVIGDGVFLDNDSIESIYISDGVEYIGDSNFSLCDNLELVYIPDSVISVDGVTADTTRYWYLGGGDPPPFLNSHNLRIYGSANSAVQRYHSIMSGGGEDVGEFVVSDGSDMNIPNAPELSEEDIEASAAPSVAKSSQTVMVDGTQKPFEVYNIGGSNYFKLRDIAYVLRDTTSRFSVDYDGKANKISIFTGEAYTIVGGEMDIGVDKSDTVKKTVGSIVINGAVVELSAYNINGNNFFKLRDLGSAIGFGVDYDAVKNIVLITSEA
jgi:hypothetical protein